MFKKISAIILFLFSFSFADSLIVNKKGSSTYIQYSQFLLAQGETIIGPIQLLPMANTDDLVIKPSYSSVKIFEYMIEPTKENFLENLIGKTISIEGDGRVIRGTVISVKDNFITLDTKNGIVVTTLPKFPNRLSSSLKWQDIQAPRVTIKLSSDKPVSVGINLIYPINGFSWDVIYTADISNNKVVLNGFYKIVNNTPIRLNDVALYIRENKRVVKLYDKTVIEPYTSKLISIDRLELPYSKANTINSKKYFPDGKVAVYKNNVFVGYGSIQNNMLRLP
jgi:hypothetical protein